MSEPALLSIQDVAAMCRVSIKTARRWRAAGRLPPTVKLPGGSRLVRYLRADIEQFIST